MAELRNLVCCLLKSRYVPLMATWLIRVALSRFLADQVALSNNALAARLELRRFGATRRITSLRSLSTFPSAILLAQCLLIAVFLPATTLAAAQQSNQTATNRASGNFVRIPGTHTTQSDSVAPLPQRRQLPESAWRTVPLPGHPAQPPLNSNAQSTEFAIPSQVPPDTIGTRTAPSPVPTRAFTNINADDWSVYQSNFSDPSSLSNVPGFARQSGEAGYPERSVALLQREGGDSAFDYPLDEPTIDSVMNPDEFIVDEACHDPLEFDFNNLSRAEMLKLLMPSFQWSAEHIPEVDSFALTNYSVSTQIPTYPFFGPPPPFISAGFTYNDVTIPMGVDFPTVLYEISLGASWIRRLPNGWFIRASVTGAFASDFENTSSDAWQLRGGLFTLITLNPQWQLTAGTLVTGREDIPVIPAAGAIWTPSYDRRVELMLPRPRIAQLVVDGAQRQQWVYLGAGFGGGTFAYERAAKVDDVLTYREWRAFLGWEFIPRREPGQFRVSGVQLAAEVGYVFGRSYEFESGRPDIDLGDTAVFRLVFQH